MSRDLVIVKRYIIVKQVILSRDLVIVKRYIRKAGDIVKRTLSYPTKIFKL